MLKTFHHQLATLGSTTLQVKVRAGTPRTIIRDTLADGTLKIDVAAVREGGKANAELLRFVAATFGVAVMNVEIVSGAGSPRKRVRIRRE